MKVTPTASDSAATIQVRINGGSYGAVASGSASAALPLNLGDNTIDVKVTAQDTTTTKIYTITVSLPERVGTWAERTVVRTLATTFGGEVDIGALTFVGGTGSIEAAVKATGKGWTVSKRYVIPIRYNLGNGSPPNTWLKVLPTHDTGANGGNNFDLDLKVSGATAQLRLRTVGTNAEVATARVALKTIGLQTFVNSTATTAFVETPTQTIAGNAVDEWKGNAGVGAEPGVSAVMDVNGGNTRGLRLRPRSKAGAPTGGAWSKGTIILDSAGNLFICKTAGTPGTWLKIGN
jgi:hypothetical protein